MSSISSSSNFVSRGVAGDVRIGGGIIEEELEFLWRLLKAGFVRDGVVRVEFCGDSSPATSLNNADRLVI